MDKRCAEPSCNMRVMKHERLLSASATDPAAGEEGQPRSPGAGPGQEAAPGALIVKSWSPGYVNGVKGEFYPCKPDVFAATYEPAEPRDEGAPCPECEGCGKVGPDDTAWTAWASLPPGSDLAVQLGIVQPRPCPACGGSGRAKGEGTP